MGRNDVARCHPGGHGHRRMAIPNEASRRGLMEALRVLYSDGPGLTIEEALAERERLQIEAAARERRQGVLSLRGGR